MKMANFQKKENVDFADHVDPYVTDASGVIDPTRRLNDMADTSLQNFMSRPIKIGEYAWSTSVIATDEFNPWDLYFNNPRVENRINNFSLMRAKLHVKFILNGNGFQYGRIIAAYQPLHTADDMSDYSGGVPENMVGTSQLPHIFLDPTTSNGGELVLPFFHFEDYAGVVQEQWGTFGRILFRTLNPLKHANGATDVVTISVFAWAEDVELAVPTSHNMIALSPQSGEIDEANSTGVVSGPATTVARIAANLKNIPYIGPFAMATEIASTATASIAKMFGYCKPLITRAPDPVHNEMINNMALTNIPDRSQKLTFDHKQELSIDPRIAGIDGQDSLNIRSIASRESYLTTFSWAVGTAPETLLFNSRVCPVLWAEDVVGLNTRYHFPACAMAALPFKFWRGTMKFRFQIVCSSFHKGRLKIVYEPYAFESTNEYNLNYLRIVDIAEETDFTVEVGMAQATAYRGWLPPGENPASDMWGTSLFTNTQQESSNGILGVFIVNELTVPNTTVNNDIQVNVFVSMGDDFEVAVPDDLFGNFVLEPQFGVLEPQSGTINEQAPEAMTPDEPSAPQHALTLNLGVSEKDSPQLGKVYFGESVDSFRTVLKRFNLHSASGKQDTVPTLVRSVRPVFPYYRGNVPGAVNLTGTASPYNYANTVMLHWVTMAFCGWRGSIRWKFIPNGFCSRGDKLEVNRLRERPGDDSYQETTLALPQYSSDDAVARSAVQRINPNGASAAAASYPGFNGKAMTANQVNPSLEVEFPFYSIYRFFPGKQNNYTSGQTSYLHAFEVRSYYTEDNFYGQTSKVEMYCAAGEDFQTYFFTGLPPLYFEPAPPAV